MAGWTVQTLIDGNMHLEAYCHNPRCHLSIKLRPNAGPWLIVEAGGIGDDIAQRVLGHVVGPAVTRAYQRSDFFEAKRRVL